MTRPHRQRRWLLLVCALPALLALQTRPAGVRYTLAAGNENWPPDIRERIVHAMDEAASLYNAVGGFEKSITVAYSPDTPTADATYRGHIRFGGQISRRVALHEISHTLGVGTAKQWQALMINGTWTGQRANALLRSFDGPEATLNGDHQHFWPYGLNRESESSEENDRRHVLVVRALRADMGLGAE